MKLYKYGDNVDTDVIIPARHLNNPDPKALASHCMEDIDASFASTVEPGDIVVAGANFGCGSSREHAPLALKSCGVKCVIAASFARIFYLYADPHLIPACKRTDLPDPIGGEILILFPEIPRIHKMILNRICIYPLGHETLHYPLLVLIALIFSMMGGSFSST